MLQQYVINAHLIPHGVKLPLCTEVVVLFQLQPARDSFCRLNVKLGDLEERTLITGRHDVSDIRCQSCDMVLGWKYVSFLNILLAGKL